MEKFVPVVVIKELSETDKILTALKNNGINCAEITFRTACAKEAIEYAYEKIFKTDTGKKLCREMFRIFDEKR